MTWQPATVTPPEPGLYLVKFAAGRVTVATWLREHGWWDGYRRNPGVRRWCEIPPDHHREDPL